jgi:hypothetical protein
MKTLRDFDQYDLVIIRKRVYQILYLGKAGCICRGILPDRARLYPLDKKATRFTPLKSCKKKNNLNNLFVK